MPPEILWVLKFIAVLAAATLVVFWVLLPFYVVKITDQLKSAARQREELLEEIFWLRKAVQTLPGAGSVARRHTVKMMSRFKGTPVDDGEEDDDEPPKKEVLSTKPAPSAAVKPAMALERPEEDEDIAPAPKAKPKAKTAKTAQQKEPTIAMPKPAASLLEDGELEDDEDLDEYEAEFQARGAADDEDEFADDEEDYEDDSLEYLDEDNDPSEKMIDLPLGGASKAKKQAQAMTRRIVVDIPEEDEITEDEEGFFVYRGERYESLLEAMKQQQADAQAGS